MDDDILKNNLRYSAHITKSKKRPSKHGPMIPYGTTLDKRWRLMEVIGAGGYGQIFRAYWKEYKIHVAVKITPKNHDAQRMILEQSILSLLQDKKNFPYLFGSGTIVDKYVYICMELLGKSLSDLRKHQQGWKFEPNTVIAVGIQALEAVKNLHQAGFVHRDIKPGNMCVGLQPNTIRTIYLLDFGLSRRFRENGVVIKRTTASFRGTLRYVSLNVHGRRDQGPCDDLISLFYSIIELSEGTLPWTKLRDPDEIGEKKKASKAAELCKNQPKELYKFYLYCYEECEQPDQPNYKQLLGYFKKCLPDGIYPVKMSYEDMIDSSIVTGPDMIIDNG